MKLDHKLRAVSMLLQTACDFVVAFVSTAAAPAYGEPEAVTLLATLWSQKMHQRELSFDSELASHVRCCVFLLFISCCCMGSHPLCSRPPPQTPRNPPSHTHKTKIWADKDHKKSCAMQANTGHGALYIVMLAIDIIAALLHSIAAITDRASNTFTFWNIPMPSSEPSATNLTVSHTPGVAEGGAEEAPTAQLNASNIGGGGVGGGGGSAGSAEVMNNPPSSGGVLPGTPGSPTGGGNVTAFLPNASPGALQTPSLSHPSVDVASSVSLGRDTPPQAVLGAIPTPRMTSATQNIPGDTPEGSVSLPSHGERGGVTAVLFPPVDTPGSPGRHNAEGGGPQGGSPVSGGGAGTGVEVAPLGGAAAPPSSGLAFAAGAPPSGVGTAAPPAGAPLQSARKPHQALNSGLPESRYRTGSEYWIFLSELLGPLGIFFRVLSPWPILNVVQCLGPVRYCFAPFLHSKLTPACTSCICSHIVVAPMWWRCSKPIDCFTPGQFTPKPIDHRTGSTYLPTPNIGRVPTASTNVPN